jgi:outer membrane protein TolC
LNDHDSNTGVRRAAKLPVAAAALVTLGAGGCALYHPQPLSSPEVEATLESPDRADLARSAEQLKHPLLAPIKLDFTKPLTGSEIEVIAVIANPDLRTLRLQQGVANAQVFAAGLLPDPQVSAGLDQVLSPTDQTLSTSYAGSISFDILGALATRHTEKKIAREAAAQLRSDIAWQEWTTAGQARLLALRLGYQVRAAQLTREAADKAERALTRTLAAAGAGDLAGDEITLRRIAAADTRDRALAAERDADATRLDLNRTLGLKPEEPVSLADPPQLRPWQHVDADQLFVSARARRLDLQAFAHGYASLEASVHRAILGQYPRLGIALNRARDTSRVHTLGPSVSLDLPLWNRNRGTIAVTKADRTRTRAEFAARLHQTRADIAALVAGLDRDDQARVALAAQMSEVERFAHEFEDAADRHDVTQPVAEAARAAALDKHIALLALEQICAEERVALALSIGSPMSDFLDVP